MKSRQIVLVLVLVLSMTGWAYSDGQRGEDISIGSSTTCKAFIDSSGDSYDAYKAYVNGFISGYGLASTEDKPEDSSTLGKSNIENAMQMLQKLCNEDKSVNFIETILRVCKSLLLY